MRDRIALGALVAVAALVLTAAAAAHAKVSPPVALAGNSQVFTLAVPTEKDGARTTSIELTPPSGFAIDSFVPAPGWKRVALTSGSGEDASVVKVRWSGGSVPTGEDAAFSFLASMQKTGDYTFGVRQTYSDGTVVDWNGPESGDSPAPVVTAVSSFGGSGHSTLSVVALVLAAVALVLAGAGLLARSGRPIA
jgi:periplasmic copper chaperone A